MQDIGLIFSNVFIYFEIRPFETSWKDMHK